ncbi:MAG: PQQ-dependent dehydrogenase, methanol/ethanol family [Alphaproteobacteria bacterium]|nr:PQQ-dependent dehydrogenase, methanol/ethanol family [Alphaproteobacteria bacterium]
MCAGALASCQKQPDSAKGLDVPTAHLASWTGATADLGPRTSEGDWPSQGRDDANTRYSTLTEINQSNVDQLKIAWTFSDGADYGHEGAPLVVGDTMYLVTPYPNIAYALDLSKPGAPIKWSFAPNPSPMAIGKACCDAVLRGWALADGKLIYNLLDAHTVAVDAKTGKEVWRTKMDDVENGATMTMSAAVYGGKVFVGNSGGELGVHGWLAALDVKTGKELWRAYNTGPDDQTRIGADYKPYYDWLKGKDLGETTWPAGMAKHGGSASWGWITYDPDLNLIYYGTSNPSPRVPTQRPGLNLFSAAVWARDADTGMAKWAYQFTPHDQWDYDGVNENVLIDIPYEGKTRKVLVQFNRNGFAYTIDRQTGQVLVAQPFGNLNWATGFDVKTGKPVVNPAMQPKPGIKLQNACPTDIGVKDWQPSAFSPRTGLLYTGMFNVCMDVTDHPQSYIAGTPYDGMEMVRHAGPGGNWGAFIAWDPVHGKKAWEIPEKFLVMSGALATASDLVFYGTVDGWFRAVNAVTGEVLWSQKLGSGIVSSPITYTGPDGQQYVAVYAGVGGAAMVESQQPGFPPRGNTLYVFSLGQSTIHGGPGMKTTQAGEDAAASPPKPKSSPGKTRK